MPEVEHVSRQSTGGRQDLESPALDDVSRGEDDCGVQVSLEGVRRPDPLRRLIEGGTRKSTPTTSAPASAISPSSSPVPTPKWMRGTSRSAIEDRTLRECGSTYVA